MSHPTVSVPASPAPDAPARPKMLKSLFASTIGNVLEWFEWSAYAVFAPFIAAVMFDTENQTAAILATLGVFAVSFLFRPLGGVVFGWVADRKGRKFVLLTTMIMMSVGSLIIGIMPTFDQIGIWAAVILLFARVLQGFAHGGESATSTTYVAEIAPNERRGLWSSVVHIAIVGGSILAYLIGAIITSTLGQDATAAWGWRIPFLIGAVAALVVLYLRRHMEESDVFEDVSDVDPRELAAAKADYAARWPRKRVISTALRMVLFTAGITVIHYTWSSYISTYAIKEHGMDPGLAYWMSLAAQSCALISLPLWGMLSDKIGRKPQLIVFALASSVMVFPLMGMVGNTWWSLFIPQAVALVLWAMASSIFAAMQAENFPTEMRTRGIGFAYSMGVALFGGTAPYLNQLFQSWDMGWVFSVYMIVLCLVTLFATLRMKETRGIDLRDVDKAA